MAQPLVERLDASSPADRDRDSLPPLFIAGVALVAIVLSTVVTLILVASLQTH